MAKGVVLCRLQLSEGGMDGQAVDLTQEDPRSPARSPAGPPRDPHRSPLKAGFLLGRPVKKKTKPRGGLWHPAGPYRRGEKKNSSHYWAICIPCDDAGESIHVPGTAECMKKHLQTCQHAGPEQKALAGIINEDGGDSVPPMADQPAAKRQKAQAMLHAVPQRDIPFSATQQSAFETLLCKATVSGNLPFQWLNNEHVRAAFTMLRPAVILPDRQKLSGLSFS